MYENLLQLGMEEEMKIAKCDVFAFFHMWRISNGRGFGLILLLYEPIRASPCFGLGPISNLKKEK
jgi:hypothetical protein